MVQCDEIKVDEDDNRPINALDQFLELDEVCKMIDDIQDVRSAGFEKDFEKFTEVLSRYQEQPHLLDKHMTTLLAKLLTKIHESSSSKHLVDACFKYIYILSKVRTYKAILKFFPHELNDFDFALNLLERQDPKDTTCWETRYILLLWMSILVLNPFHMSRLDPYLSEDSRNFTPNHQKPKIERVYDLCLLYTQLNDTCSSVAAYLTAKYLIRADVKDAYMEKYFQMVMDSHTNATEKVKYGQLSSVAAILKHAKRDDVLQYADRLLHWIVSCKYKDSSDFLRHKYSIKIIQRIGMVYLKPVIASWRYKRGLRSLAANLSGNNTESLNGADENSSEDDIQVPEQIEEVIEELLQGLKSPSSDIRWSSAKGLGRVTGRLPKDFGDDVIGSIIEIFNPLENHEAWHGACVAIAELSRRGLLLPYRLQEMVPHLTEALFYDEMKAYMSVGQHIRDAACYMCWAFARAYDPKDLQPFVNEIAAGLLTVAVFDREINCRRAASAAFQESVGRLGNFPYGIEISTTTDFFTVGLKQNTFLNISNFITQFEEYKKPLIDHLVDRKVGHWDVAIRELTSKTLNKLTHRDPIHMANVVLPILLHNTNSIDLNKRSGSVLAIGEVVLALRTLEIQEGVNYLKPEMLTEVNDLMQKFIQKEQFRGMSGEIMKACCTEFVKNCSKAKIPVTNQCIESWQEIINKCIVNKNNQIMENATAALTELCEAYYNCPERAEANTVLVCEFIKGADNDLEEHIRKGYLNGIGAFPRFLLIAHWQDILNSLMKHSLPAHGALEALLSGDLETAKMENENSQTFSWSEARRDSVKALSNVLKVLGFENGPLREGVYIDKIFDCFLKALSEYTMDNRGDIGAWVREAAMNALAQLLTTCPPSHITPEIVHQIMVGLSQQAVEKIDRTRGLAGRLFCNLVHFEPRIPYIQRHEKLREIFPADSSSVLWLFADHTFPYFCAMLELPEYSSRIILGLTASIGQLTESLIKYSSTSFFQYLRSHPSDVPRICDEIVMVFEQNSLNERVTYPLLNFLDILFASGTVSSILLDETNTFAEDIFRFVNTEIKGHKKLYKLTSSINVYCQMIQVPRLSTRILSKLSIFLGLTHVHVRKTTATKLYEALALHSECTSIPEENLEDILNLLSESDWGLPLTEVRPIRNNVCELMGIKPPVSAASR